MIAVRGVLYFVLWPVWFACWSVAATASANGEVHVVLSESERAYEETADAFADVLGKGAGMQVWDLDKLDPGKLRALSMKENLLVPIGLRAVRFVAEHHAGRGAVLGLMVPRSSVEQIRWPGELGPGSLSFVYIDQPIERSLALLSALMPHRSRVGAMVSSDNGDILKTLQKEAGRRGLTVNSGVVDDPAKVGLRLRDVLSECDVFLLLPDAVVLSGGNIQSLLLASYRMRVPVLGFSPGLVKSGAVAAVFSTPHQIGAHGGQMARRWLAGAALPPAQHATQFSVDINSHVARSMGLPLPTEREVVMELGAKD